jgi:threonyl-tRNA synthetase
VLERRGKAFEDGVGHAAFYGPKIDIQVQTVSGAEETLSTVQVDFAQPGRLGLQYVAASGTLETPFCIHRAPFSTHERLVAHLLELYGGALPLWLSPVQVLVAPVSLAVADYAAGVVARLRAKLVRAELGEASATVAKSVRAAALRKIPLTLVVGAREQAEGRVAVRQRGDERRWQPKLEDFEAQLLRALECRAPRLATE